MTTLDRPAPMVEATPASLAARPRVGGKFLFIGADKLYVRGVTYGTFPPDSDGLPYPSADVVDRDFAQMAANGFNAVRTYTVPPRWLLDAAERHGLRVMVGLPWEQHIAFLDDRRRARRIEATVRAGVRACTGHPAVLCYAIGNEIPAPIVRWHGARRVERFLRRLYDAAKAEDPAGLVTYVNYPTTEYLDLPFLDLVCFNVYLESQAKLAAYLARLQNIAGERPLILAEIGLDSRRHGEDAQARALDWQVRAAFAGGCAGAFVFAWTDEWHRGGHAIEDWDFGLTGRDRRPKPALAAVRAAFADVPFPRALPWPRISVIVCSYNGERTIRDCCEGLLRLDYPDFEVIVVDDGSTDATAAIAREHGFRVISQENRGLGSARNTGLAAATGEIVAYTDDDARPDPLWLGHLAATYMTTPHVGVGGPNIAPAGDGPIADCVANAPGGPVHVLLSDTEAEHIPGCNSSFRREALEAIGGYDPRYRAAGDDVDVCWRLQERGWTIGFSPAAMVWHHRRDSLRAYWRQQQGYGKAEALLEEKWPAKYNAAGHTAWAGRLYGTGLSRALGLRPRRVYQGTWGGAPFQAVYPPATGPLASLPLMPEWYLVAGVLAALAILGLMWPPLLLALPLLAITVGAPALQAVLSACRARLPNAPRSLPDRLHSRALTAALHMIQPAARLRGRLRYGLTPWRHRGPAGMSVPRPRTRVLWSERWHAPEAWLATLEAALRDGGSVVRRGGDFDRWDLEARGGLLGATRLRIAIEEHGAGRQLARFRVWPRWSGVGFALTMLLGALGIGAALDDARLVAALLGAGVAVLAGRAVWECAAATGAFRRALAAVAARAPGETAWMERGG